MTTMRRYGILAAGVVALSSALCYGTPSLGTVEDFSGGASGWNLDNNGNGGVSLTGVGGALQLSFPNSVMDLSAIAYADNGSSSGHFVGDYVAANVGLVNFSITSLTTPPSYLAVYLQGGDGQMWLNYVTAPTGLGLQTYAVAIGQPSDWIQTGTIVDDGSALAFSSGLHNVLRLGFYAENGTASGTQLFNFDDVSLNMLPVPEPETIWLLLAAVASLGITFRSKVGDAARSLVKRC